MEQLKHPDMHLPWSQWSEDQTLHVAVCYTNPFRWATRRKLMNNMRRHMEPQPNIKLYVGELAYGDRPWEVTTADNPQDLQMRTEHELFHKENVQNVVINKMFPKNWKYGCCVDGDFLFTRYDWALETIHQLQHYEFVQPFSSYADLSGGVYGQAQVPVRYNSGFFFNYIQNGYKVSPQYANGAFPPAHLKNIRGDSLSGYGGTMVPDGPFMRGVGATGGAMAFRHLAYDKVQGLLDKCILGHADWCMAFSLAGVEPPDIHLQNYHPNYKHYVQTWRKLAISIRKNIGYVDGHAIHYWHGSKTRRAYSSRDKILAKHQYDPYDDIVIDSQGIYKLNDGKLDFRDDIRQYFISRFEDDPNLSGAEKLLV